MGKLRKFAVCTNMFCTLLLRRAAAGAVTVPLMAIILPPVAIVCGGMVFVVVGSEKFRGKTV